MSPIKTPRAIRGTSWAYRDPGEDRAEIRVCNFRVSKVEIV